MDIVPKANDADNLPTRESTHIFDQSLGPTREGLAQSNLGTKLNSSGPIFDLPRKSLIFSKDVVAAVLFHFVQFFFTQLSKFDLFMSDEWS